MTLALFLSFLYCLGTVTAQTNEAEYSLQELDTLILYFFQRGEYREALHHSNIALQKELHEGGKKSKQRQSRQKELGILYTYAAQYDKAAYWLQKAREQILATEGRNSLGYASILQNTAYLYKTKGQYKLAEKIYLRSLQLYQNIENTPPKEISTTLNNLGTVYQHIGAYDKAEEFYKEAQGLRHIYLKTKDISLSVGLNNLAALAYERGQYRKSEQLFLEAHKRTLAHYGKGHIRVAVGYFNLAKVYKAMARYETSEQLLFQAKNIWEQQLGDQHPRFAVALSALAALYKDMGRYQEAKTLYSQARQIRERIFGENTPHYAKSLHNLASLYLEMEDYEKAEPLYWQSHRIWKKTLGPQHPDVAENLQNLGDLYRKAGDLKRAEPLLQESKAIRASSIGIKNAVYASNLQSLGELYKAMGAYQHAQPLLLEAKDLFAKSLGSSHPRFLQNLHELADLHYQQNELQLATDYCLEALAHNSPQLSGIPCSIQSLSILQFEKLDFHSYVQTNRSLALLLQVLQRQYEKTGRKKLLNERYHLAQTAMRINERMRNALNTEEDQLRILRSNTTFIAQGIASALQLGKPSYIKKAFSFAELNKSMLLADALKSNRARSLGDLPDSLAALEVQLKKRRGILTKRQYRAVSREEKEEINKALSVLQLEIDAFLKSIKDKYPKYHTLRYQNITAKAKEVQKLLSPHSVLIEYFLTDSLIYVFSVQGHRVQLKTLDISRQQLNRRVKLFRQTLSNYRYIRVKPLQAFERYAESAHWFYKTLVAPALPHDSINQVIFIPDGELGHLPFEAFLNSPAQTTNYQDLDYLLHRYRISYHYSATLWKEQQLHIRPAANARMLAFAADYSILSEKDFLHSAPYASPQKALRPLNAARKEVELLSQSFNGQFSYGKAANEARFKQLAPKYDVIHLAMHGLSHPKDPLLSSLAFSPSSGSKEDDFLQAYEIGQLSLKASLVVLSACESGYGKFEQGEGIISLARSFMHAGVSSLVVSLWQMSDASAAQLMRNFYKGLSEGKALDAALQQAKQDYISQTEGLLAHPAFWASFIQLGKNHQLILQKKRNTPLVLLLIWLIAVAAGLFLSYSTSVNKGYISSKLPDFPI